MCLMGTAPCSPLCPKRDNWRRLPRPSRARRLTRAWPQSLGMVTDADQISPKKNGTLLGSTGLALETSYRASTGFVLAKDAWDRDLPHRRWVPWSTWVPCSASDGSTRFAMCVSEPQDVYC